MADMASELVRACIEARADGADFPTIWQSILSGHPLVSGLPVQGADVTSPALEVHLLTGQCVVYRAGAFTLE